MTCTIEKAYAKEEIQQLKCTVLKFWKQIEKEGNTKVNHVIKIDSDFIM